MRRFILQRLVSIVITLWLLATIVFLIVNVLPGNPGRQILGALGAESEVKKLNHAIGADKPLMTQYITSVKRIFTFDFGGTYRSAGKKPVTDELWPALGNSAKLAVLALLITLPIALFAGITAARKQDKVVDRVIVTTGLATSAIPEFVTAFVLQFLFAFKLGWGKVNANPRKGTSLFGQLEYLLLPAMAIVIVYFGYIARMTRAGVINGLQADYARTAAMKGLAPRRVLRRHVLRNALAPTIVVISTQIGYLLGGMAAMELVFSYNGLGLFMKNAINAHEVPKLQAAVLVIGVIYMVFSLLADLLIAFLNPRVRLEGGK